MTINKVNLAAFLIGFICILAFHVFECRYIHRPVYQPPARPYPGYYEQQSHYYQPYFSPPGTFYDKRRGILRTFPGGGVPILVDYHKRCSGNYVGIKPHPNQRQYYYVCKSDCVIFGKCQHLNTFNATTSQCIPHSLPEFSPKCIKEGRFPINSDCTLYYKCDCNLMAHMHSCPEGMIFSSTQSKCIPGKQCPSTQISTNGSYIPENCEDKFPPCLGAGTYRSPKDCSLYYTCEFQSNGHYLQTRFMCPGDNFYDVERKLCLPPSQVACDCIQIAKLVYSNSQSASYPCGSVYPAYYHSKSLEDHEYPMEDSKPCDEDDSSEPTTTEILSTTIKTTTLEPIITTVEGRAENVGNRKLNTEASTSSDSDISSSFEESWEDTTQSSDTTLRPRDSAATTVSNIGSTALHSSGPSSLPTTITEITTQISTSASSLSSSGSSEENTSTSSTNSAFSEATTDSTGFNSTPAATGSTLSSDSLIINDSAQSTTPVFVNGSPSSLIRSGSDSTETTLSILSSEEETTRMTPSSADGSTSSGSLTDGTEKIKSTTSADSSETTPTSNGPQTTSLVSSSGTTSATFSFKSSEDITTHSTSDSSLSSDLTVTSTLSSTSDKETNPSTGSTLSSLESTKVTTSSISNGFTSSPVPLLSTTNNPSVSATTGQGVPRSNSATTTPAEVTSTESSFIKDSTLSTTIISTTTGSTQNTSPTLNTIHTTKTRTKIITEAIRESRSLGISTENPNDVRRHNRKSNSESLIIVTSKPTTDKSDPLSGDSLYDTDDGSSEDYNYEFVYYTFDTVSKGHKNKTENKSAVRTSSTVFSTTEPVLRGSTALAQSQSRSNTLPWVLMEAVTTTRRPAGKPLSSQVSELSPETSTHLTPRSQRIQTTETLPWVLMEAKKTSSKKPLTKRNLEHTTSRTLIDDNTETFDSGSFYSDEDEVSNLNQIISEVSSTVPENTATTEILATTSIQNNENTETTTTQITTSTTTDPTDEVTLHTEHSETHPTTITEIATTPTQEKLSDLSVDDKVIDINFNNDIINIIHTKDLNASSQQHLQRQNRQIAIDKRVPVINNCNLTTVADASCTESQVNGTLPKIELTFFEPADISIRFCPRPCNRTHIHNYDPAIVDKHALAVKWMPNSSNKTMILETA